MVTLRRGQRAKQFCHDCYYDQRLPSYQHDYYLSHRQELIAYQQARRSKDLDKSRASERQIYLRRRDRVLIKNHAKYWADPEAARSDKRLSYWRNIVQRRKRARGQIALIIALEKQLLTDATQQEWKQLPRKEHEARRRALLALARKLGVITPSIMEVIS